MLRLRRLKSGSKKPANGHVAKILSARAPEVLQKIEELVRANVKTWNAGFPNDLRRQVDSIGKIFNPKGFVLHKTYFPSARVEVWLDPVQNFVAYTVTKRAMIGNDDYSVSGRFHIELAENGSGLYLTGDSHQQLSLQNVADQILELAIGN